MSDLEDNDFEGFGPLGPARREEPADPLSRETARIGLPPLGKQIAQRAKRRRRIVMWLKVSGFLCVLALVVALIGAVGAYFYCKPRYDLAHSFDMTELDDLEVASQIFDRNGKELGRIYVQNRRPIPLEEVSKNFVNALLAAEDGRFYEHDGVDYIGIVRALYQGMLEKELTQGASTITQQLARNTFDLKERSLSRKVTEAFLARRVESELNSKQKILELYINRIYFGAGYYGISAAAEGFFGKDAKNLSLSEAATLAGVVRNPYYRSPRKFPDASKKTRNSVLYRMYADGYIDENEMKRAQDNPIRTVEKGNVTGKSAFVYEKVRQEVIDLLGYEAVAGGGFQIHTTIDGDIQQLAEKELTERLSMIEEHPDFKHQTLAQYKAAKKTFKETSNQDATFEAPEYLQGALLMIDNKTGSVLAQIGSRDFSDSMFDRTTQGRRPPGTAFTPFVYAAAFQKGLFPGTLVDDAPMDTRQVMIGGTTGILGEWGTEDFQNVYEGRITSRRSLAKSKNAASVYLGQKTGLTNVVELAEKAGLTFEGDLKNFNATLLGRNPVSMDAFCLAYTVFPNNGRKPERTHIISDIRDREGAVIYSPSVAMASGQVIDQYTAYQVTSSLADSFKYGTAKAAKEKYGLENFAVAGKTGTEYNFTDNWFIGYTSEVTCVVWTGFDQNKTIYPGAFSSDTVLPVWTEVMNAAADRFEPRAFLPPPDADQVEICLKSGELASDDCYEIDQKSSGRASQIRCTYVEYLRPNTVLDSICSIHGRGGNRLRNLTNVTPGGPARAMPMIIATAEPVMPLGPTLIGKEDPYNSVAPIIRARVAIPQVVEEDPEAVEDPEAIEKPEVGSNGLPVARPIIIDEEAQELPAQRVTLPSPRPIEGL